MAVVIAGVGGCGRTFGVDADYVLSQPLEVSLGEPSETVVLPAGTRVGQRGFKEDVAFVEVRGRASPAALRRAGVEQR